MELHEFYRRLTTEHAAAFETSETLADFLTKVDTEKPGLGRLLVWVTEKQNNDDYYARAFRGFKRHGFVAKALRFPEVTKVSELFESVKLFPMTCGGYRNETPYVRDGRFFVSALRCKDFAYFGYMDAKYDFSPDWLERGEKIRRIRGGKTWLTAAKGTKKLTEYWAASARDSDLATVEAIRHDNGKTLLVGRSTHGFSNEWLAYLDAGETCYSLYSKEDASAIAAENAKRFEAWGAES